MAGEVNWAASYERAAAAIVVAIQADATTRKRSGSAPWGALLSASEFHDRCLALAGRMVEAHHTEASNPTS